MAEVQMKLKAIGMVRNQVRLPPGPDYDWSKVVSTIVIDSSLAAALDGLEEFSHIIVLYWLHQVSGHPPSRVHPRGRPELPLVGLFASRAPDRPNPIGKSTVRLLERQGNILKVEGLDAIDGTPVIDIKPYIPARDSPADAKVPQWVTRL